MDGTVISAVRTGACGGVAVKYLVKKDASTSILITSTEPKEGKTFVASNLAYIYQMSGKKVILIDADLRRPALTQAFDLSQKKGLSYCLIGKCHWKDAIITREPGLDILPAGDIPPNPSELLRSGKIKEIIQDLNQLYDYVIIDCSPVGLVADAHFLAGLVDTTLYIVRDEKTNKNFLRYTLRDFAEDGINNVAIVYNDVNVKHGSYYSSRYYGKGYGYYNSSKSDYYNS
jgi:capsular exopolysaccharide synthesis family protein